MDFQSFMDDDERNFKRVEHLSENQVRSGADVARELGISRVAVKKTTQKAMSKVYKAIDDILGNDSGPLKNLVYLAQMFGVENDEKGMSTIFKNLSTDQKKIVLDDVSNNYPGFLKIVAKD